MFERPQKGKCITFPAGKISKKRKKNAKNCKKEKNAGLSIDPKLTSIGALQFFVQVLKSKTKSVHFFPLHNAHLHLGESNLSNVTLRVLPQFKFGPNPPDRAQWSLSDNAFTPSHSPPIRNAEN